jgi:uncharacterized protein (TIGR00251 family)
MLGMHAGEIRAQISAPPTEGKANRELISFLSKLLGVPRSRIRIEKGAGSRHKQVTVEGVAQEAAERVLGVNDV